MTFIKFLLHTLCMTWCFHMYVYYYSFPKKCITGYSFFFVTTAPKIYFFSKYLEWNTVLITNHIVNYISGLDYPSCLLLYFLWHISSQCLTLSPPLTIIILFSISVHSNFLFFFLLHWRMNQDISHQTSIPPLVTYPALFPFLILRQDFTK